MTTNESNYSCLEQTSMPKQPEPATISQPQDYTVSDEQKQFLNVERLTLARKVLQAGHAHAPNIEALILKQIEGSQRDNPNSTCHHLPTSLMEFALTVASQPQNYIVGDEEELKRLILARKVMETHHLHLPNPNALAQKRIQALERNFAFTKQDPRLSDTSTPVDQPSVEASVAAPADTSPSNSRQHRFTLTAAFFAASNDVGTCMFRPLSLLFDQNKKHCTELEHFRHSSGACRSVSFAADAIRWTQFSDVEGSWLTLGLHEDLKTLYLVFEKQADMLDFLTRIRW